MKSMEELFHGLLQDVYFAEKKLLKTLPKLAKNLGKAKKEFKQGLADGQQDDEPTTPER